MTTNNPYSDAIACFTNTAVGLTSFVFPNVRGGFNVTLRDDDAEQMVPIAVSGIASVDDAMAKAAALVA